MVNLKTIDQSLNSGSKDAQIIFNLQNKVKSLNFIKLIFI